MAFKPPQKVPLKPVDHRLWAAIRHGELDNLETLSRHGGNFQQVRKGGTLMGLFSFYGLRLSTRMYLKMLHQLMIRGCQPNKCQDLHLHIYINSEDELHLAMGQGWKAPQTHKLNYYVHLQVTSVPSLMIQLQEIFQRPHQALSFACQKKHQEVQRKLELGLKLLAGEGSPQELMSS